MEVEVNDLLEGGEIEVGESLVGRDGGSGLVAAGTVDEGVDAAPLGEDGIAGFFEGGAVVDIGLDGEDLGGGVGGANLGEGGVELGLGAAEIDDAGTLGGEIVGGGAGEGAGGAGNDDDFAGEIKEGGLHEDKCLDGTVQPGGGNAGRAAFSFTRRAQVAARRGAGLLHGEREGGGGQALGLYADGDGAARARGGAEDGEGEAVEGFARRRRKGGVVGGVAVVGRDHGGGAGDRKGDGEFGARDEAALGVGDAHGDEGEFVGGGAEGGALGGEFQAAGGAGGVLHGLGPRLAVFVGDGAELTGRVNDLVPAKAVIVRAAFFFGRGTGR